MDDTAILDYVLSALQKENTRSDIGWGTAALTKQLIALIKRERSNEAFVKRIAVDVAKHFETYKEGDGCDE
jgi:hypothetical protein